MQINKLKFYVVLFLFLIYNSCSKQASNSSNTPQPVLTNQSPINIDTNKVITLSPAQTLAFGYTSNNSSTYLLPQTFDNGYFVGVINNNPNDTLVFNDSTYILDNIHFHITSEHRIQGQPYPIEIHFVHKNKISNSILVIAVFGLPGTTANPALQTIIDSLPTTPFTTSQSLNIPTLNFTQLLPNDLADFYTYFPGSATYPSPYATGYRWVILKTPIAISNNQWQAISTRYNNDFRAIQPIGSRIVYVNK